MVGRVKAAIAFRRRNVVLGSSTTASEQEIIPQALSIPTNESVDFTALVVNSSHDMAKEITLQLTLSIPGCSIVYAPTIELAAWILRRRKIDLVVSSAVLPDGGVAKLKPVLDKVAQAPNLVVVGDLSVQNAEILGGGEYEFRAVRKFSKIERPTRATPKLPAIQTTIRTLGADIRNDLNNPLQEIVAMIFVAQANTKNESTTEQALAAIDRAAKNMASVVGGLEGKILQAVSSGSAGVG